jgi:hypothetical protein
MLKISTEQMKALSEPRLRENLISAARNDYSELFEDVPDRTLERIVDGGIAKARRYGLAESQNVAEFVFLMFEFAPQFDRYPSINKVLSDTGLTEKDKIATLRLIPDADWEAASADLEDQSWFSD